MKLSKYRILLYATGLVIFITGIMGCDSSMQSPYEDFIKDGEIVYPSKVDSLTVLSGNNRMMVQFLKPDDPTISKARIYWKNKQDSIDVAIDQSQDTVNVLIDSLKKEGTYAIDIHLFDKNGNISIGKSAIGHVYGNNYSNSISSRPTSEVSLKVSGNRSILIDWVPSSSEAIGTEITYVDSTDSEKDIFVPNDSIQTEIFDLRDLDMSNLEYKTLFKPEPTAIDTFYASIRSAELENILLRNSEKPFEASEFDGTWGIPAYWFVNEAAKNRGDLGGIKNNKLGLKDSSEDVINGKIYKTMNLPSGNYSLEVDFKKFVSLDEHYIAVAEGDSLPNTAEMDSQALAYTGFGNPQVNFSLSQQTKITLGFVVTMTDGKWWVNSVRLNYSR